MQAVLAWLISSITLSSHCQGNGAYSMNDSSMLDQKPEQNLDFPCDTAFIERPQGEQRVTIVPVSIRPVSDTQIEVHLGVLGASGATIETQWPNGTWASIGTVRENQLLNPAVPASYLLDPIHIRVRIAGVLNSVVTLRVTPIWTSLSSSRNGNGSLSVTGITTLPNGIAEAYSDNQWKGIGSVVNGRFFNPAIPSGYLYAPGLMRLRVRDDEVSSDDMISTLGFPHLPSVLIYPLQPARDEQRFMNWRHQKADYQPTGYFAPAGVEVEVWAWGNVENVTLLVGIQGMADRDNKSTQSESMRATPLVRGRNVIRDPLGGVIHIRSLTGAGSGGTRLEFRGNATPIPYYIKGVTSTAQWREMLAINHLPEVELVGDRVVIAAFPGTVAKFANVEPFDIVDSHESVMRIEAEVSGLDGSAPIHSRTSLLLYAVEGNASANPHATTGYTAYPYRDGVSAYNEALVGGLARNRWVALHEYGHHYQTSYNSYGPFVENSVNIYALAVARQAPNEYTYEFPTRWPATRQWLALPRSEKTYGAGVSDPQEIFEQLRKGLGINFLPEWHRYIRENPCPSANLMCFVLTASIVARYNLTDFFADWGLLKSTDTDVWAAVAALNLPYPPAVLTNIRPYVA